ncbi:unnamed protein product [Fructobacillus evanidus]|uniref:Uncharacterized protein n=1 Tax=Fructobacillus evanidus TaxID=3064281 RepID=A0ABM9MLP2_9LACO|nr:unnamed protein product [Fructobacillus sp. LMG 32999]CAK1222415.1 unnamed protein product [Fructobacillus sp. LMG 32999]CAK1224584.1 unnamed protein product [Fructobacillus sp. LMG 32999]CAK1224762.1 unnamed protein product [Fructobacillus sp. LMG 32999]CAK1224942.1 unnamed protein product [Fructobacillus sp. LMG 32999]
MVVEIKKKLVEKYFSANFFCLLIENKKDWHC